LLHFQVTEALTLVIKLAEYLAKLPKVRINKYKKYLITDFIVISSS